MTADQFREARQSLGLSASDMAAALGFSRTATVYEIESGRRKIGAPAARLVCAYLDGYRPPDWPS
jgi:DNA-binding transcriptional regulator YiaG